MKRYLTVGIISGVLVGIVVAFSWYRFPAWQNPASGGFWGLLGATIAGILVFVQSLVSIWKDLKEEKKEEPNPAPARGSVGIGGNVGGNFTAGNNNVVTNSVVNNYYPIVEKNTEKHEPDYWALKHPYPMPKNFTGRIAERAMLAHWLNEDTENHLFILRALGGFGKSALSWQWLTHDVKPEDFPKALWWSFYEGDASFEHFIEETLKYLKLEVPQGQRPQVDELLKAMGSQKIVLIMDGFERALRAYSSMNAAYQGDEESKLEDNQLDCVNINAEFFLKGVCSLPNIKSKVLMTTRLTPRAVKPRGEYLQGCREVELTAMQKTDAVEFFHKQKIKGTHTEIEAACAPYGYHPLSLRLLAGRILKDFENPADSVVAQKLRIDGDIIQQKHHVLEVSYNSLPQHEQKLLSTIACFRSPVGYKTLQSIAENKNTLDAELLDLVERGLLNRTTRSQSHNSQSTVFDLHPIVRRYAYERSSASDRTAAHIRLRDYFVAVDIPAKPHTIDDLAPVIELYYHTIQAGELDEAQKIYRIRLADPIYFQLCAYQIEIELMSSLFLDGEDRPPRLKDESAQAWTLNTLATSYGMSGQPRRAIPLLEMNLIIREKQNRKDSIAIVLNNLTIENLAIGELKSAEQNLHRQIDLCREIEDEFVEAIGHLELGRVQFFRGVWQDSEQELSKCLDTLIKVHSPTDWISKTWAYRSQLAILRGDPDSALRCANEALKFSTQDANEGMPIESDFVRDYWLIGAAFRASGNMAEAERHLNEALTRGRSNNLLYFESDLLLDLARLRYDQKNFDEAKSLAEEALLITERCGYVLQGADVNLFLAQYVLERENDQVKAKEYAKTALKLATCDGPPYCYKVAYEEAERMLERLKAE
jgi:tetratricopeptide (TPR) repeat protein